MRDERRDALEMLERTHRRMEDRARELREVAASLAAGSGSEEDRENARQLLNFFTRSVPRHFADEEQSVFPRLSEAHAALAEKLTADHRIHESALDALLVAIDTWREPPDVDRATEFLHLAERLEQLYREHAALEDVELLPVIKALPEEVLEEIATEMAGRRGRGGGGTPNTSDGLAIT